MTDTLSDLLSRRAAEWNALTPEERHRRLRAQPRQREAARWPEGQDYPGESEG